MGHRNPLGFCERNRWSRAALRGSLVTSFSDKGMDMEVWCLSLTITRAVSGYGLVAASMSALAVIAHDSPTHPQPNASLSPSRLASGAANARMNEVCDTGDLNTCAPRVPMRALSAKEVALIMGANSHTGQTSHGTYNSHGSCSANGCHTTATVPPPVTSGPPASSLGGGSSGSTNVPDPNQQQHLVKCAGVYGHTSPNPKYQTNFTNNYGWSYYAKSTGLPVAHDVTQTDNPPSSTPSGAGDGEWLAVSASTFFQDAPYHTDLYVYAYSTDATTVGVLMHEWYHQNNDVSNESTAQRQTNEQNATAAGKAAEAAYDADNGAQCAN